MVADIVTVSRLPIFNFIFIFIAYIISHIGIGLALKQKTKELEQYNNANEEIDTSVQPHIEQLRRQVKGLGIVFKWFPAIVVIGVLIFLYV